jgi:hypothetical protein
MGSTKTDLKYPQRVKYYIYSLLSTNLPSKYAGPYLNIHALTEIHTRIKLFNIQCNYSSIA